MQCLEHHNALILKLKCYVFLIFNSGRDFVIKTSKSRSSGVMLTKTILIDREIVMIIKKALKDHCTLLSLEFRECS